MTELLCHTDAYLKEFDATISRLDPEAHAVVLTGPPSIPAAAANPATSAC